MSLWEPRNSAGNIELVRRSGGENAEKNTPATQIADLCHLQHPEEGFSVFFLSLQQTAHKPALLGVCLPALCQQHPGWTLPASISKPLESPVPRAGQSVSQKTRFPSCSGEETLRFHSELQLVHVLENLILPWH